ncbi:MAG: protease complex subunit PrcB family protein [Dorea formicigenerans]
MQIRVSLHGARVWRKRKTGYSVEVNACYETSDAIRIQTTLLGPAKGEKTKEKKTYPYVVMKTEYREKDVIFE